jgi:hypothetical protein
MFKRFTDKLPPFSLRLGLDAIGMVIGTLVISLVILLAGGSLMLAIGMLVMSYPVAVSVTILFFALVFLIGGFRK